VLDLKWENADLSSRFVGDVYFERDKFDQIDTEKLPLHFKYKHIVMVNNRSCAFYQIKTKNSWREGYLI